MAFSITEKLSVTEAKEWLANTMTSLTEADDATFIQAMHDFKGALPRKPRAAKKASSSAERAEEVYNEAKCDARVWLKGGFAAQCRCKKVEGQFLCSKHQTEADKHDGLVKNGLFNQDRPTHHYNTTDDDKELIAWHDVVINKPEKKAKAGGGTRQPRKCGCCGESGHDKRSCPNKETKAPMSVADLEAALAAAKVAEIAAKEAEAQDQVLEEDNHDLTASQQAAAGTGLLEAEEAEEAENAEETEDTTPSIIDCTFEKIPYNRNKDDEVMDDMFEPVGTWDGEKIVFSSLGSMAHKFKVAELPDDDL
jgi:hypothetical protein